jgi:chromosome segregation ATPase
MTKLALAAGILIVGAVTVAAQSAGPASEGTLGALLQEVRAMRAEMQRNSAASIRAQLLVARQQLLEQRINMASRDMLQIQNELAGVTQTTAELSQRLRDFSREPELPADIPPERREQMRAEFPRMAAHAKQQLQVQQQREFELRQQEQALTATITEAQAQWSDMNNRLDALERQLALP